MSAKLPLRPTTVEKLATAVYPSFAMIAGIQLDVFTPLKDGPLNAGQIAGILGTDSRKLEPLLYALVAIGLLTVEANEFANTPEADAFLVRGRPGYIGTRQQAYERRWQSVLHAAESVRTGKPLGRVDYASMASAERETFYRGLHTETLAAGRELGARQDFSQCQSLVDIGGGSGGVAIAMAEAWPHLSVTIVDLPATIPLAQRYVAEARLADRVRVTAGDLLSGPLGDSYDAAILRGVLIVLDPDQVPRFLENVFRSLEPGGAIYVVGWILDDSRSSPLEYATFHPNCITAYDRARLYTESELRSQLLGAGFRDFTRERSSPVYGSDFAMARKPGRV